MTRIGHHDDDDAAKELAQYQDKCILNKQQNNVMQPFIFPQQLFHLNEFTYWIRQLDFDEYAMNLLRILEANGYIKPLWLLLINV